MTREIVQKSTTFVQTIMHNEKSNKNYVSARVRLYKNLNIKSSMLSPPDPDLLVEELKRIQLP